MNRALRASSLVFAISLLAACGDQAGTGTGDSANRGGGAAGAAAGAAAAPKNEIAVTTEGGAEEVLAVKHAHYTSNTMTGKDAAGNQVVWPVYYIFVSSGEVAKDALTMPEPKAGERQFMIEIYGVPGGDKAAPPKAARYPAQSEAKDIYTSGTYLSSVHMRSPADGSAKRDDWYSLKGNLNVTSSTPEAIAVEVDIQSTNGRQLKGSFRAEPR